MDQKASVTASAIREYSIGGFGDFEILGFGDLAFQLTKWPNHQITK
jgi:hypothetical protein